MNRNGITNTLYIIWLIKNLFSHWTQFMQYQVIPFLTREMFDIRKFLSANEIRKQEMRFMISLTVGYNILKIPTKDFR